MSEFADLSIRKDRLDKIEALLADQEFATASTPLRKGCLAFFLPRRYQGHVSVEIIDHRGLNSGFQINISGAALIRRCQLREDASVEIAFTEALRSIAWKYDTKERLIRANDEEIDLADEEMQKYGRQRIEELDDVLKIVATSLQE